MVVLVAPDSSQVLSSTLLMHNILKTRTDKNFPVLTFLRFVLKRTKFHFLTCSDIGLIKFFFSDLTIKYWVAVFFGEPGAF